NMTRLLLLPLPLLLAALSGHLVAIAGETVTFATTVTPPATPFLVVTWSVTDVHGTLKNIITSTSVNETMQEYRDRITLFRHTGSLELRNVSLRDAGDFTVTVIPAGGAQQRGNCKLDVHAPVSRVEVKTNATEMFEFSGPVHLSCSSTGTSPSFRWLNGSSEVTESERVQITGGGSKLTVLNVTRYDLGPFRCHVFNLISNGTSGPVVLSVHFGPENMNLTSSPSQENYDEGSDVSLICSVASGPPPQLRWFRNGDLLSHAGSELKLLNIHFHQSGNYSCQAFNDKTMRNVTSDLIEFTVSKAAVLYRRSTAEISNVVIAASSTDVEELSGSVRLSCSSAGSFPTFVWRNGSAELAAGDGVHIDGKGAVVTILNVSRYDEGPYTCHVFNNFSNATSRPLKLSISCESGNVFGSNISLSCSAACRPSARFEWFLNGESLSRTGPNLNLVNVLENQSGNYSCRAVNIKTAKSQMTKPSVFFPALPECDCWAAIGVAAAIAVGCCILSVILIGLIVYGLRRRKR
uniref:Ig-like domain-containing protein n=1 Tax=Hippocampus comes TaxID=109280 RepID=A0A3Q2XWK7_HIPCM